MKLSDFNKGSDKKTISDIQKKIGRSSKISFVNETKTKSYEDEISSLTAERDKLKIELNQLGPAKVERKEAVETKNKVEKEMAELIEKFATSANSLQEYDEREPKIQKLIEQHRELNGQVAELQGKLQIVIEEHDNKVDMINKRETHISELKNVLHKTESAHNKATQSGIEANMKKDALQARVDQETTKNSEMSIIYQEVKDKVDKAQKDRNEFEVRTTKAEHEKQKAFRSAQRFKELSENYAGTLKDLASRYYHVTEINKDMMVELKKPKFASVASISKREGFKFPTSYEPRDNTLGTAKPTLLRKKV